MNFQVPRGALAQRKLCALNEVPDGGGKGMTLERADGPLDVFVLRQGDAVYAYVNSCPHVGTPLDWVPDQFMHPSGDYIMCATHGAVFEIADGTCVAGPCLGGRLQAVPVVLHDGTVMLAD